VDTVLKGRMTESLVLNAFVLRDYPVMVPFGEGQPYDLVVDVGDAFLRVQCKSARPAPGCLLFNARTTDHGRGPRSYLGRADVFGVCHPADSRVYLVPVPTVTSATVYLRLEAARNNQRVGIRLAADYEIDRWSAQDLRALAVGGGRSGAEVAA